MTTTPISCVVVDDERLALKLMADYVMKTPFFHLVEQTTDPLRAMQLVQQGKVDLLFLDIQMPELTGIQLLKVIGRQCKVILTTAYPDYALEGYEFDVVDYLLKPVTFDRFLVAAHKARERLIQPANQSTVSEATPQMVETPAAASPSFIFVKTEYKIQKIDLTDILYFEGLRDYVAIHTTEGKILTLQSIRSFQEQLAVQQFVRVHKSYLISIDKIRFIERNRVVIGEQYIPIGDTYQELFHQRLNIKG